MENKKYLIPDPFIYLASISEIIFSYLREYDQNRKMGIGSLIGKAQESIIEKDLEHIFKQQNVKVPENTKNPNSDSSADFYIELDKLDLVIEVKRNLVNESAQNLLSAKDISLLWKRLYKALSQCSKTLKYKNSTKTVIPIILVAQPIATLLSSSFQVFAEQSGMAEDLGVPYFKIMSWDQLQKILSSTSIKQFEEALLNDCSITPVEAFTFPHCEPDIPSHSYEYNKDARQEIFPFSKRR